MNRHHIWALALASGFGFAGCGDDTGGGTGGAGAGSSGTMSSDGGSDGASTGSGGGLTHGSPAEGLYVFALSARLDNSKPILFQGNVVFGDDPGAPTFTLSLTPLRTPFRNGTDNEAIPPLTLLPPPLDVGPFDIAADGSFDAQFPEVQVTGRANVFSLNNLQAVVEIKGRFSEDPNGSPDKLGFVCGTLEGQVIAPIALELTPDENFFSMTKIDASGTLPNDVAYNCAGDRSDPFVDEGGTGGGGTGGQGDGGNGDGGSGGAGGSGTGGDGTGGAGGDGTGGAGGDGTGGGGGG